MYVRVVGSNDSGYYDTTWLNANKYITGNGVTRANAKPSIEGGITSCISSQTLYTSTATKRYCNLIASTIGGTLYVKIGLNSNTDIKFEAIDVSSSVWKIDLSNCNLKKFIFIVFRI